jgi:gamma-glutamylputrescine oxidase
MRRDYGYRDLHYLDRAEVRRQVASEGYHSGTLDERGGHLHALNYALGIARAATTHGAKLHEGVTVTSIERSADGFRVGAGDGSLRADRVVLAANGYLRGIAPAVHQHVMPINNYIAVTEPLGARANQLINQGRAVSDSRFVVNYFRITPDQRLLFGGGENYGYRFPHDIAAFVRPHLLGVFPQLATVRLDYAWGGTLAITPNRMPWIRELTSGFVNASGFSGLGVVMAPFTGKIIADALAGDRRQFDLIGEVPIPAFPGGAWLRFPTLVAAMFYFALRDRL